MKLQTVRRYSNQKAQPAVYRYYQKSYIIQTALLSEEKRLDDDPISKVLCWSDVDLMAAAGTSLIRSQSEVIKEFNNFIEPWENVPPTEESFGNRRRLLRKYEHVCIFDEEEDFTGRVVNVE